MSEVRVRDKRTHNDRCEVVLWRNRDWRCEYWLVSGRSMLRLCNGKKVVQQRPFESGPVAWEQSEEWRASRPGCARLLKTVRNLHADIEQLQALVASYQRETAEAMRQVEQDLRYARASVEGIQQLADDRKGRDPKAES